MKNYVVRTHEGHWDNDFVVAKFTVLDDAMEYICFHFNHGDTDCYSISIEESTDED